MSLLLEIDDNIAEAYKLMEKSKKNVIITGRAGTGKSTLIKYFIENTNKNVVVLAPTGVAAINIGGQTIHSFFKFGIDVTVDKITKLPKGSERLYKLIDTIVIDEISMVRSDIFDCIDKFMRLNGRKKRLPFGGVQMILVGDIYQLPPVVTKHEEQIFSDLYDSQYFFDSKAFKDSEFEYIELEEVFRQQDENFVSILNSIRNNTVTDAQLRVLNSRVDEDFIPSEKDMYVHLTTTRDIAEKINNFELSRIDGETITLWGDIRGEFDERLLPTDRELHLKIGAQIMLINNDAEGRWINGTIGRILDFEQIDDLFAIVAELDNGEVVEITPYTWKLIRYNYDREKKKITTEQIGSFTQYPVMLAWAITIHKSQGKTFERVIIDLGRGTFAHGQLYVALSRCRSLDGIVLRKPIEKSHIIMDKRVVEFITQIQYIQSESRLPQSEKLKIIKRAIDEGNELIITYLKKTDEKSRREVVPLYVGELDYGGNRFLGLRAIDKSKNLERNFKLERILDIETKDKESRD
ncbi:MAG: AAA family ATPase [Deltaproteobacteria bacterium]|nr:AAA family ATPase [Deltaproteobacteria bacterium]